MSKFGNKVIIIFFSTSAAVLYRERENHCVIQATLRGGGRSVRIDLPRVTGLHESW